MWGPLRIYIKHELIISKYVPLWNIKINELSLITSGQHLINRREMLGEFYQAHFRSSRPEAFLANSVLKMCSKFTGEHPCRHRCSPVNLLYCIFSEHLFLGTPVGGYFWHLYLLQQKQWNQVNHSDINRDRCNITFISWVRYSRF